MEESSRAADEPAPSVERTDVEVTPRIAERAAEAEAVEGKVAWALVVVGALFTAFFPILSVLAAVVAVFLARRIGAQTPLIAAAAVGVIGLLLLLFQGTGGFLGEGDLFNA